MRSLLVVAVLISFWISWKIVGSLMHESKPEAGTAAAIYGQDCEELTPLGGDVRDCGLNPRGVEIDHRNLCRINGRTFLASGVGVEAHDDQGIAAGYADSYSEPTLRDAAFKGCMAGLASNRLP